MAARRISLLAAGVLLAATITVSRAAKITVTCLNNTGDAALINNAIAGSAAGDEIIIVGPGLINQTIRLSGSRSYQGTSRTGTVLKQANGANLVAMMASTSYLDNTTTTGSPMAVRHLTLDGNQANNTTVATTGLMIRSWETQVEDIEAKQMRGDGICVTSFSANNTGITNTQVNGRIADCFVNDCSGCGIRVDENGSSGGACTDWTLLGNTITNSGLDGISLDNSAGWFVIENTVTNSNRHGIYASRCYGTSISNNIVQGFGRSSTSGTYYGIGVTLQGTVGSVIRSNQVKNTVQAGNSASTHRYVDIIQTNYGSSFAAVTDNVVTHSITTTGTSVGYYYNNGGGVNQTVASSRNSATGVTTPKVVGTNVTASFGL